VLVSARTRNGDLVTYDHADEAGRFLLRIAPGSEVDVFIGASAAERPAVANVRAGATGIVVPTTR
jgi:hypothetical protein